MVKFNHVRIERDKTYTLLQLAEKAGMNIAEVQELVQRGKLASHITDDTQVINGQDFLNYLEKQHKNHH